MNYKSFFLFVLIGLMSLTQPLMAQEKAVFIYRFGNQYMQDGVRMNEREYAGFIKNTCPEAFKMYQNGHRLAVAGWCMLAGGLALDIAGAVTMTTRYIGLIDEEYRTQREDMHDIAPIIWDKPGKEYFYSPKSVFRAANRRCKTDKTFVAGSVMESIGSAALITSVPLLVVGYVRIHRSADVYNQVKGATPYVTLNAVPKGMGLALNF